ncbi:uncharacterized protein PHA67_011958 [Liasis olivaceus]
MGKQAPDVCGPSSPTGKWQADRKGRCCHKSKKVTLLCAVIFAILLVFCLVFLSLYVEHFSSDSVRQLSECRGELQEQAAQMRASNASLGKLVEKKEGDLEKARAERDGLRAQLAATNHSLAKTSADWGSCQEQLKSLKENVTSQVTKAVQREVEKYKLAEEQINQLKQQLSNLQQDLKDTQQKKEQQQDTIKHLQEQLMNQAVDRSSGGLLLGPSTVLLLLIPAGLLM